MNMVKRKYNKKTKYSCKESCWLFLDCEMLTGFPADKCPNIKSCKNNALLSQNRWCFLPYQKWLPEIDQLWKIPTLEVSHWVAPEAREAGYDSPVELFYTYSNKDLCLTIGRDEKGRYLEIPPEALDLGFDRAEQLPYKVSKATLTVEIINNHRQLKARGWQEAVELPYALHHDMDTGKKFIKVTLDINSTKAQDAIDYGWHPGHLLVRR